MDDSYTNCKLVLAAVLICTTVPMAMTMTPRPLRLSSATTLLARRQLEGESSSSSSGCWESLYELQSCTGEVIIFFVNGETRLGRGCCSAIRKIELECWPQLLGALGFTTQETNILRRYCDDAADTSGSVVPPPPPSTVAPNTTEYGQNSRP